MSDANVEIVKATIEAWNREDMDAIRPLLDPDIVLSLPANWPEPGPYVGREAVVREWEHARAAWHADAVEPISEYIHAGDLVVVRVRWHTSGSGPDANIELTVLYTIRNGRILLTQYFWDHSEALAAVGLSEPATTEVNVAAFRAALEAFRRGDFEMWMEGFAEDGEFEFIPQRAPIQGDYRNRARLRAFLADNAENFEVFDPTYDVVRGVGDRVIA